MSDLPASRVHVRIRRGLREPANWQQLGRFALVGGSGYAVNLIVFSLAVHAAGRHHSVAATAAFLVAVTNNFLLNRVWTFGPGVGRMRHQAWRFLAVSVVGFVVNLAVLEALVAAGLPEIGAQAIAVAVAMPVNFVGNRLWTFSV
jgi:putative flippase GtrA